MNDNMIFWHEQPANVLNISDAFHSNSMSLIEWENRLATGWRHNGMMVYRSSLEYDERDTLLNVLPLRYRLSEFNMSKSQRKVWRKNQDLTYKLRPLSIRDDIHFLFEQHTYRFKFNVPYSIFDFVSIEPGKPFDTWQFEVYKDKQLIACTFLDITPHAISSTYAMFDLEESKRSLGVFTMLLEMAYGVMTKKEFHYPGYAYLQPSFMDYKKNFAGVEYFDWLTENWFKL